MKHILRSQQFSPTALFRLFKKAEKFRKLHEQGKLTSLRKVLRGLQLITLFYEPSTRTRISFEIAARLLGMGVTTTENAAIFSSAAKGESLEDSIRVLCEYHPSAIVLRHNETGAAERAAKATCNGTAIINAGDGKGQHPTQAALDLYTIHREFGSLENLTIVLAGDLANGRTGHSLCYLLSKFKGVSFIFVAPPSLQMKKDILDHLTENEIPWELSEDLQAAARKADVLYMTRVQKERLSAADRRKLRGKSPYRITLKIAEVMKRQALIMHPLPRVDEIETTVDSNHRATYFAQAGNGLYMRMALLWYVLGRKKKRKKK